MQLRNDPQHVEHVQDLWGDRLTAVGVQSPDGKAVYVQLNLAGNQGTTLGAGIHYGGPAVSSSGHRHPPVSRSMSPARQRYPRHGAQWQRFHAEDDR